MRCFLHGNGSAAALNFRVIGGTVQPAASRENDIWVDTDTKIPSWYIGPNEPNVYDIQPISAGDPHWLVAPHELKEGDILNFVIPAEITSTYEAIRIHDPFANKFYFVRSHSGESGTAWYKGTKIGFVISNQSYPIGAWGADGGSALISKWGDYFHKAGTAWFGTSYFSSVAFNALKKNALFVYPNSVKQYIYGEWESMNAYIFRNGEWVQFSSEIPPWDGTIYRNGTEETVTTGGLTQKSNVVMKNGYSNDSKIEKKSDRIVLGPAGYGGALLTTVNKVDLTKYNTLTIKGSGNGHAGVHDFESGNIQNGAVYGTIGSNTNLDISQLTGLYYITFGAYNTDNTYTCYEVYVS